MQAKLIFMIKRGFIFIALLVASIAYAQESFEGIMEVKVMNSYSEAYVHMIPYLYSGVDTMEIKIKGNAVHIYTKQNGIHKIYKEGKMWYYSEYVKEGFSLPRTLPNTVNLEEIDKNETRIFLGQECATKTYLLRLNNTTVSADCIVADNVYNIDPDIINLLNMNMFGFDTNGKICMKVSMTTSMTGNIDVMLNTSKLAKTIATGSSKGSEISCSQIYEVLDLRPQPIDESQMMPGEDIIIEDLFADAVLYDVNADTEELKAALMKDPKIRKKVESGKANIDDLAKEHKEKLAVSQQKADKQRQQLMESAAKTSAILGKDAQRAMVKTIEDDKAIGGNAEKSTYGAALYKHESKLLALTKEYMKQHNKIKKETVQPVAYDLDEEWDF